jgi:hypothetical protein
LSKAKELLKTIEAADPARARTVQLVLDDTIKVREQVKKLSKEASAGVARAHLEDCYWKLDDLVGSLEFSLAQAKGEA